MTHAIVSQEEWLEASRALLAEEEALLDAQARVKAKRRAMPWVRLEKEYVFEGAEGPVSLADLFDGRSQLLVYHFMFAPEWQEGCPGCSLLADGVDGAREHFEHVDVSFVAISRAPFAKLDAYRQRMGWRFRWVSSAANAFNYDFHVSFPKETRKDGVFYNFAEQADPGTDDLPGASAFIRDDSGAIFHTYSVAGRGGGLLVPAHAWLNIAPDSQGFETHDWVRRRDAYPDDGRRFAEKAGQSGCCAAAS